MAVPKSKISKSRRNMRRSHDALAPSAYHECSNSGELKRPHHVCPAYDHSYRKSAVKGKSVLVAIDHGGRRISQQTSLRQVTSIIICERIHTDLTQQIKDKSHIK